MLNWNVWQGDGEDWDKQLLEFQDFNIFQSHGWGEHRKNFGWLPIRLKATLEEKVVSLAQVLVRRYPFGLAIAWVPGGPVGRTDSWDRTLYAAIRRVIRARFLYCRINPLMILIESDATMLATSGWKRPKALLNSGQSMVYNPVEDEDIRLKKASGNWRHNLRRSSKYGHVASIWTAPDAEQMYAAYADMQSHKQLQEQFSKPALQSILNIFKDHCLVVRCDDQTGQLLSLRGCLYFGDKAWDTFAVTTTQGRKVYASHAAFWKLMQECADKGIGWYDMGGIDPDNSKGVFDFKNGTGAENLQYLGEWEWGSFAIFRYVVNHFIARSVGGI